MAEIPGSLNKILEEEVDFESPVSEQLDTRIGASINQLIDDNADQESRISSLESAPNAFDSSIVDTSFSHPSPGTFVDSGFEVTIETRGGPVLLVFTSANNTNFLLSFAAADNNLFTAQPDVQFNISGGDDWRILKNGSTFKSQNNTTTPFSSELNFDVDSSPGSAGTTVTYKLQLNTSAELHGAMVAIAL